MRRERERGERWREREMWELEMERSEMCEIDREGERNAGRERKRDAVREREMEGEKE